MNPEDFGPDSMNMFSVFPGRDGQYKYTLWVDDCDFSDEVRLSGDINTSAMEALALERAAHDAAMAYYKMRQFGLGLVRWGLAIRRMTHGLKSARGRPRKYDDTESAHVKALIAAGRSHREISAILKMPVPSVGNIAKRLGVKRTIGDRSGGPRTKGVINTKRRHTALGEDR